MPLTIDEQKELSVLEKEFGTLTPEEQKEFYELDLEFGDDPNITTEKADKKSNDTLNIAAELELPLTTVEDVFDPVEPPKFDDYGEPYSPNLTMDYSLMRSVYAGIELQKKRDIEMLKYAGAYISPDDNKQQYITIQPESTNWESIKKFFISEPEEARWTKKSRYEKFHDTLNAPMQILMQHTIGRMLQVPQLGWSIVKRVSGNDIPEEVDNMNLVKAMGWAANYNPSGFVKLLAGTAEIIGGAQTSGEIGDRFGLFVKAGKGADWGAKALRAEQIGALLSAATEPIKGLSEQIDTGTDYGYGGLKGTAETVAGFGVFSMSASAVTAGWEYFLTKHPQFGKLIDGYFKKQPKGTYEESHLNARREVLNAQKILRETGDRTEWDRVRAYYTGVAEGRIAPSPTGDITVKDFGKYPIVKATPKEAKPSISVITQQKLAIEEQMKSPPVVGKAIKKITPSSLAKEEGVVAEEYISEGNRRKLLKESFGEVQNTAAWTEYEGKLDAYGAGNLTPISDQMVYIPEKFKGEVSAHFGDRNKKGSLRTLWNRVTFNPTTAASSWDKAAQERELGDIDVDTYLQMMVDDYNARKTGKGNVPEEVLNKLVASKDWQDVALAAKIQMLQSKIFSEKDITDEIERIRLEAESDELNQIGDIDYDTEIRTISQTPEITAEELAEREAIQREAELPEVGDFLEGLNADTKAKYDKGLLGQDVITPISGEQGMFLEPKDYKLPEPDIEGQKFLFNRYKGFVRVPPLTTVGKISEENPNITIKKRQKDLGILQARILTITNQAANTKNKDIINAAEEMADKGITIWQDIESQLTTDFHVYSTLPKEYRQNKGEKFFGLMDKYYSPEDIRKSKLPSEIKVALEHFKLQDERMRLEIVEQKRQMAEAMYKNKSLSELQSLAEKQGIETKKPGITVEGKNRTKAELSKDLAEKNVPGGWGKQWSHIQHIFFGQYELRWLEEEVTEKGIEIIPHFIGRAETQTEAYQKLYEWKIARKEAGFDDYDKLKLEATPEIHLPLDVLRISRSHYLVLADKLKEAAEISNKEVQDALRGIVGKKEAKQKWWGSLMYRKGAKGYSQDFKRVWATQTSQFQRWKQLTEMNRNVQPLIEKVRQQGLRRWATYLEETKDFMWGRNRSDIGQSLDEFLQNVPVVQNYVKPFALERWTGIAKTINYWRHLQTGRFYVINSLQSIQTLWPVIGEKGMYNAIKLYYSKEGQNLLKEYKVGGMSGKLHELGMVRGRKFEKFLPAGASEIRNQGLAFLGLYSEGTKNGMMPENAARYARLRGQIMTQFAYSPADIPPYMRGPVGGLLLQYKRFPIKNLELVSRLFREGNYGGVARWTMAQLLLGGIKTFTKPLIALPGAGYLSYQLYKKIKEKYGEDTANLIDHGLPSLVGIDISGSISMFDMAYGRNIPEKIGNTVLGPSGQWIIRLATDIKQKKLGTPKTEVQLLWDSTIQSSPTLQQFDNLIKLFQKDTSVMDVRGRKLYDLELWDIWKKTFGFRPETESIQRMQYEAMLSAKYSYDEMIDEIVLAAMSGRIDEVYEIGSQWEAMFPEIPISVDSIETRIKERNLESELPLVLRGWKNLPDSLKGEFGEEALESLEEEREK